MLTCGSYQNYAFWCMLIGLWYRFLGARFRRLASPHCLMSGSYLHQIFNFGFYNAFCNIINTVGSSSCVIIITIGDIQMRKCKEHAKNITGGAGTTWPPLACLGCYQVHSATPARHAKCYNHSQADAPGPAWPDRSSGWGLLRFVNFSAKDIFLFCNVSVKTFQSLSYLVSIPATIAAGTTVKYELGRKRVIVKNKWGN